MLRSSFMHDLTEFYAMWLNWHLGRLVSDFLAVTTVTTAQDQLLLKAPDNLILDLRSNIIFTKKNGHLPLYCRVAFVNRHFDLFILYVAQKQAKIAVQIYMCLVLKFLFCVLLSVQANNYRRRWTESQRPECSVYWHQCKDRLQCQAGRAWCIHGVAFVMVFSYPAFLLDNWLHASVMKK